MKTECPRSPVLWIEFCHGLLLLALFVLLVPIRVLEPWALVLGGVFMGANFLFLSCGIHWVLTPFATKGRIRAGLFLLLLKFFLFLGVASALFQRLQLDAASFAVGISSLLAAVVMERIWASQWGGE
jgi:hypothetical protein